MITEIDSEILQFWYKDSEEKSILPSDIIKIYSKLGDEQSKNIFTQRILFSLTSDWVFMSQMLQSLGFEEMIKNKVNNTGKIYIYGAGISGSRIPLLYPNIKWEGYIDKKKAGEEYLGLKIHGIEYLKKEDNTKILVSNLSSKDEIKEELLAVGIEEENIYFFSDFIQDISKGMYFESDIVDKEFVRNKVFVDAGAYDGGDTLRYFEWMNDISLKSRIFEADPNNVIVIKSKLKDFLNVKIFSEGISNTKTCLPFISGKQEMSNFDEDGDCSIKLTTLDEECVDEQVGFIKMDIEGFESAALIGSKHIIENQKPCLAISIYHKRCDIWKIPLLILEMNSNYKLFLRHYSLGTVDTVLYAV